MPWSGDLLPWPVSSIRWSLALVNCSRNSKLVKWPRRGCWRSVQRPTESRDGESCLFIIKLLFSLLPKLWSCLRKKYIYEKPNWKNSEQTEMHDGKLDELLASLTLSPENVSDRMKVRRVQGCQHHLTDMCRSITIGCQSNMTIPSGLSYNRSNVAFSYRHRKNVPPMFRHGSIDRKRIVSCGEHLQTADNYTVLVVHRWVAILWLVFQPTSKRRFSSLVSRQL